MRIKMSTDIDACKVERSFKIIWSSKKVFDIDFFFVTFTLGLEKTVKI